MVKRGVAMGFGWDSDPSMLTACGLHVVKRIPGPCAMVAASAQIESTFRRSDTGEVISAEINYDAVGHGLYCDAHAVVYDGVQFEAPPSLPPPNGAPKSSNFKTIFTKPSTRNAVTVMLQPGLASSGA